MEQVVALYFIVGVVVAIIYEERHPIFSKTMLFWPYYVSGLDRLYERDE